MARLVGGQLVAKSGGQLREIQPEDRQKRLGAYLERITKYIPVEIVAAFMAVRSLLATGDSANSVGPWGHIIVYAALLVLTPLYLRQFGGDVPQKTKQIAIGTISFVVWSYAIGGPVFAALEKLTGVQIMHQGVSGAVVILWTLCIGLFNPTPTPTPTPAPTPTP